MHQPRSSVSQHRLRLAIPVLASATLILTVLAGQSGAKVGDPVKPDDHLFSVPSGSMIPTLADGDLIVVDEQPRNFEPLRTGEIVVFHGPAADANCGSYQSILVKRVIGLPGEVIQSKGSTVYINNKALKEPWLPAGTVLGKAIPRETVPPGKVYMLGDNRDISCDSRYWGTVSTSSIIGKVVLACSSNSSDACRVF
jgi:signal peptidase I